MAVAELIDWEYQKGNAAVEMLLTAGAWLDQQDDRGETALMKRARAAHEEGAIRLIEAGRISICKKTAERPPCCWRRTRPIIRANRSRPSAAS